MKTYQKQDLSRDERGYFRYIGGRRFRLGKDVARARVAVARLEALLARVGETYAGWDDLTLRLANAIARAEQQFTLPPNPEMIGAESYVHWVDRHAERYGDIIRIVPEQAGYYGQGQAGILTDRSERQRRLDIAYPLPPSIPTDRPHERLHTALDAYANYLAERTDPSGWVHCKVAQANRLKAHKDIPLSQMTLERMEGMLSYWANRPNVKGRNKPISALTARNQIKEMKDFWKWLHRSDAYGWKRPDGWDDLKPRIVRYATDRKAHIETFTIDEMTILYRNATPLVRVFILLGLNCGFSIAEICGLTTDEVYLSQQHPHATRVRYAGTDKDGWILRVRHKSGVYGEFKLWPETALALEWACRRMKRIKQKGKLLLVTEQGRPFNAKSATGNKSSRISNLWNRLYRICRRKAPDLRRLPFKFLRKTGGDFVRQVSDGEVAGVFLCHGQPVKSDALADVYTNRPFAKVFDVTDKVGKLLERVFTDSDRWV